VIRDLVLPLLAVGYVVSAVPRRRPPVRTCEACGHSFYRWSGVLCPACVKGLERPSESLRGFRRRLRDDARAVLSEVSRP